ncbi:hypothetical protein [Sediminivirga luteola]|jgi:acyl-coenzyme A synthetase/AMP-(fatty) acid ligase|uniref:Uncharacterized protein n=1 Tax=Sediminivirga luteola TaxID=1774748 RepID=A0A8J2U0V7_9MICO|nr:hypothetical protein [Sediminivirga luteola]MCI2264920.1 hypothetical protein [Sediminivirga luteola]GGA26237.1 hypothetical protein GCM10011333_31430 [Sediminivirga luteola]
MRLHWFTRPDGGPAPDAGVSGTLNLPYQLLDYPVALGRADDLLTIGDEALSLSEVLDRSARAAGVLRLAGLGPGSVIGHADLRPAVAALIDLAALRIGGVLAAPDPGVAPLAAAGDAADAEAADAVVHPAAEQSVPVARMPGARSTVRHLASPLDGLELRTAEETLPLGALARDARLEPAAAIGAPADRPVAVAGHPLHAFTLHELLRLQDLAALPPEPAWLPALLRLVHREGAGL